MKKYIISAIYIIILLIGCQTVSNAADANIVCSDKAEVGQSITINVNGTAAQWNLTLKVNGETIAASNELDNVDGNKVINFSKSYTPTQSGSLSVTLVGTVTEYSDGSTKKSFSPKTINVEPKTEKVDTINDEKENTNPKNEEQPKEDKEEKKETVTATETTGNTKKEQPKEITFKDTNETMYTSSRVNLRKKYGTDGEIYKTIPEGEELTRTGYSKTNVDGYSWSRVQYNGGTYYCITKSLTATKPEKNDDEKDTKVNETEKNETTVNETSENLTNEVTNQTTNEISQETVVKDQNGDLKKLEIPGYILSPLFKSNVYEYKLSVTDDVMDLDVKAEPASSNVQIEIAGNKDLKEGENIVTIMCYNKETKKNTTYQIIVEKKAKENIHAEAIREASKKRSLIIKVGIGLIIILIIACIIVFKKGREEQQEEYEQEKEEPKSLKEFKKESESKNEPVKSENYEKTSVEKEVTKVKEVKNESEKKEKTQKQREEEFDEKLQKIKNEKRRQQKGGKHF